MTAPARFRKEESSLPGAVVPAFNGQAERFLLRAFRLFRRSLMQSPGDAGKVLVKHLRTRVPADALDRTLADFTTLMLEIYFVELPPRILARAAAKQSSKQEFFFIALLEATQRRDQGRAAEAAMALLDTFEVGKVLDAACDFADRLREFGLWLTPIADAPFNYFADYQPLDEYLSPPARRAPRSDAPALRLVSATRE